MKGIRRYQAASGFSVVRVHYSADSSKNPDTPEGAKWLEQETRGYIGGRKSAAWRQEQEIDWDAAGGELVFPDFDTYREKIVVRPFSVPETWRLYASFDYGHRNPSSLHVYAIDHDDNIFVVWEFYGSGYGYTEIARNIRLYERFEALQSAPLADPSIWAVTQQTENDVKSIAQLFAELPPELAIYFIPGQKGGDITAAEKITGLLWKDLATQEPRLKIFASCPMMIWELERIRYADWSATQMLVRNQKEKIVDKDNHAFDDLKMFLNAFFAGPGVLEKEELSDLKATDYNSYREWKAVNERFPKDPNAIEKSEGMGQWD